mmetsp:Transcript_36377/g.63786  ORF Transcript_36377/g.63786 Transcript_36377/m.63786 type:complete len:175 (-) Transcript_36377:64-588(-)
MLKMAYQRMEQKREAADESSNDDDNRGKKMKPKKNLPRLIYSIMTWASFFPFVPHHSTAAFPSPPSHGYAIPTPKIKTLTLLILVQSVTKGDQLFYPESRQHAILISECVGGIVVDYGNSTKAKKHYLVLSPEWAYKAPQGLSGMEGALLNEERRNGVAFEVRVVDKDSRKIYH